MYCSSCELEIKGEGKQSCPICGGALSAGPAGSATTGAQAQENPALHEIIEDINSLIDGPAAAGPEQETVFVLKDYGDDSTADNEPAQLQASFADEQGQRAPAADDVFRDDDVSLQDRIDSIQQSLMMSDSPEADMAAADSAVQADYEDFGFPRTFEPDGVFPEEGGGAQAVLEEFDGDESSLISARPAARRRPALVPVLLVVLLAGAGYCAYRFIAADSSDEKPATVRTVMPLSALTAEQKQADAQPSASEKPAPSGGPSGTSAAADAGMPAAGVDAQPPRVSEETAWPAGSMAAGQPDEAAGAPAAPADTASAEAQPGSAAAPAIDKPLTISRLPAEAPAQDSPGLQAPPADQPVSQPTKTTAAVAAPFYTVHVGSYRSRDTAASEASRIRSKGHDAFVERADLGQRGIWYRVKVGRFKTRAEAEALKAKVHKVLVPESVVVMNDRD